METLTRTHSCAICGGRQVEVFTGLIMGLHMAHYDQCRECGFLQVRTPFWLDEAYSEAICASDTGLVSRNLMIADALASILPLLGSLKGPFLDYGGGLGLLVRLMRDRGFDFRWSDSHARNELARGFEYDTGDAPCIAVTAIEVLEHVVDPVGFVRDALAAGKADTLIFTTELYSGALPPDDWWYFAREEGQHIGFYRRDTLEKLGERLGLRLLSNGWIHMFTRTGLSESSFRLRLSRPARMFARLRDRFSPSLTQSDHERMKALLTPAAPSV